MNKMHQTDESKSGGKVLPAETVSDDVLTFLKVSFAVCVFTFGPNNSMFVYLRTINKLYTLFPFTILAILTLCNNYNLIFSFIPKFYLLNHDLVCFF